MLATFLWTRKFRLLHEPIRLGSMSAVEVPPTRLGILVTGAAAMETQQNQHRNMMVKASLLMMSLPIRSSEEQSDQSPLKNDATTPAHWFLTHVHCWMVCRREAECGQRTKIYTTETAQFTQTALVPIQTHTHTHTQEVSLPWAWSLSRCTAVFFQSSICSWNGITSDSNSPLQANKCSAHIVTEREKIKWITMNCKLT